MGLSLQEQLLKAGIADKKKAKKARHEERVKRKKNKGKKTPLQVNKTQQEQLAQNKRSQELNRKLNKEKEKRGKQAQISQLIKTHRLKLDKYEDPYYFKMGKKIKKLYVNQDISKKLAKGDLAIIRFNEVFEIVPGSVANQILDRDPDFQVIRHDDKA